LDDEMRTNLKDFFKICYSRLEMGEKEDGDRFESLDLIEEIIEELADVSNYAFLQYLKLLKLREKLAKIDAETK
jgi:hypothetical protein